MKPTPGHRTEEADIGSGESSPGKPDTDKMIRDTPPTFEPNPSELPPEVPPESPPPA